MGRRRKKGQFNLILLFYISFILMFLVGKFVNWLATLSMVTWYLIFFSIISLILCKRYITQQRKIKENELRKLELERQGNLNDLKKLHPVAFEHYICDLFKQLGYDAHVTKTTGDGGKDIMIYKKDFHAIAECKRYDLTKVTRPQIQRFHSAIIDCKAEKGYFITTGLFTAQATSYVLDKPIELINGQRLVKLIEEITKDDLVIEHIDMVLKTT